jgi:hypothetical protein
MPRTIRLLTYLPAGLLTLSFPLQAVAVSAELKTGGLPPSVIALGVVLFCLGLFFGIIFGNGRRHR